MKKNILILLYSIFSFIILSSCYVVSFAEDFISWELKNGILVISGEGKVANYSAAERSPWYNQRSEILEVIIENGITEIGSSAFVDCSNLKKVTLNNEITHINSLAFLDCNNMEMINLPNSLKYIGDGAFKGCESLKKIVFPDGLQYLGHEAFFRCSSIDQIIIPSSVSYLGKAVFSYCTSLNTVSFNAIVSEIPTWTFYSCYALQEVTLSEQVTDVGSEVFTNCINLEKTNSENQTVVQIIVSQVQNSSVTDEEIVDTKSDSEEDNYFFGIIEENNNSKVSIEVKNEDLFINANVSSQEGLEEAFDTIISVVENQTVIDDESVEVIITSDVALKVDNEINKAFKDNNIKLTLEIADAEFIVDYQEIEINELRDYNVGYSLEKIDSFDRNVENVIENSTGFYVNFKGSSDIQTTVKFYLGKEYAKQIGSLFQLVKGKWSHIQSSIIDDLGYVTFYLENFDSISKYMVGININGIDKNEVLVPDSMGDSYGGLTDINGKPYEVTGIKSSWGITLTQFSLILFVVFGGTFIIVGLLVYVAFKLKHNKERIYQEVMSQKIRK